MPSPRLSNHAERLRNHVNRQYPDRDKRSDGWIGDPAHAARASDHNPDAKGIVRALDIDADLIPGAKDRTAAHRLAEMLRQEGKRRERPIAYVIFSGKITSPKTLWRWARYSGSNPHNGHIHVSFRKQVGE